MARKYYLDDEYSPLGDGYYQPLYRENGHEIEADYRDWEGVKTQLGLEYDDMYENQYYDPEEVDPFDPDNINDHPSTYYSLSKWATEGGTYYD